MKLLIVLIILSLVLLSSSTTWLWKDVIDPDIPLIIPSNDTFYLKEGQELSVVCYHKNKAVHMSYPESKVVIDDHHSKGLSSFEEDLTHRFDPIRITSLPEIKHNTGNNMTFKRRSVQWGDSGWYGCATDDINIEPENPYQQKVKWFYVFVENPDHWFAEKLHNFNFIGTPNDTLVVPCRPTNPEFNVTIEFYFTHKEIQFDERISYNPKIGLRFSPFLKTDAGEPLMCVISYNGSTQFNFFTLKVSS